MDNEMECMADDRVPDKIEGPEDGWHWEIFDDQSEYLDGNHEAYLFDGDWCVLCHVAEWQIEPEDRELILNSLKDRCFHKQGE